MTLSKINPWEIVLKDSIKIESTIMKIVDLGHITMPIMESYHSLLVAMGKPELIDVGIGESIKHVPVEFKPIILSMQKAISDIYMKERINLCNKYLEEKEIN
jgi:hypothetical protein